MILKMRGRCGWCPKRKTVLWCKGITIIKIRRSWRESLCWQTIFIFILRYPMYETVLAMNLAQDQTILHGNIIIFMTSLSINSLRPSDAYMRPQSRPSLVQIMAWRLAVAKPLSEPMLAGILLIGPLGTNFSEILLEIYILSFIKMHLKMSSRRWRPFCLGLNVLNAIWGHSHSATPWWPVTLNHYV